MPFTASFPFQQLTVNTFSIFVIYDYYSIRTAFNCYRRWPLCQTDHKIFFETGLRPIGRRLAGQLCHFEFKEWTALFLPTASLKQPKHQRVILAYNKRGLLKEQMEIFPKRVLCENCFCVLFWCKMLLSEHFEKQTSHTETKQNKLNLKLFFSAAGRDAI